MTEFAAMAALVAVELGLFAACLFLLFGIDYLLVDILRLVWPHDRSRPARPARRPARRRYAIFVPAWREQATIADMLATLSRSWPGEHVRIYVGVYPNDLATMLAAGAVAATDRRIRIVINDDNGPTSKGGCLNRIWRAAMAEAGCGVFRPDTVILHDAEDLVDAQALTVFDAALPDADYVQLPVIPVADPRRRWIGGHYCDEFAEAHLRDLPVRSAIGAALPLAGVGCAIAVTALQALDNGDGPFAGDSVTEDYELGIRLSLAGYRGRFVAHRHGGRLVATRSCFPLTVENAVRQKTRWMQGIALEGWDRIGWPWAGRHGTSAALATLWMLWRDRRSALAAIIVCAGYLALGLMLMVRVMSPDALGAVLADHPVLVSIGLANLLLLLWRGLVRMLCTGSYYGWRHGPLALMRIPVANILLIMTAWRAIASYWRRLNGAAFHWEKTEHQFPDMATVRA